MKKYSDKAKAHCRLAREHDWKGFNKLPSPRRNYSYSWTYGEKECYRCGTKEGISRSEYIKMSRDRYHYDKNVGKAHCRIAGGHAWKYEHSGVDHFGNAIVIWRNCSRCQTRHYPVGGWWEDSETGMQTKD